MSNKNMCINISNNRVVKNGYLLRLNALTSEVTLFTIVVALDLCLVLFSTLALLALCYIAFFRPKVTSSFGIPPLSFAFRPKCLPPPKLGDKEGVLVHPHALCLKFKMTRNISKSPNILPICQNKLHLPPSRFDSEHITTVTYCSSKRLLPTVFRSRINANIVLRCSAMLCFESIIYCSNFKVRARNLVDEVLS